MLALLWQWLATVREVARIEALTARPTWSVDAPARDAASPTGYVAGQRRLIVPGHHNATYWWIMEAQQAVAERRWRLRQISHDTGPDARDPGRTAPYRSWLIAVGWAWSVWEGVPLGHAIERGALIADPLLLSLLLIGGGLFCARRLGAVAAAAFVVGAVALFPLAANFRPGAPDSHALAWVLAVGSILPLLVPRSGGTERQLRGCFALAGFMGGLGFWNDAPTQMIALLAVSLAGLGAEWLRPVGEARSPWRLWAGVGAVTSLAAAAFEFAPGHFTWSLAAVHPVHALVWWAWGEVLHGAGVWRQSGGRALGRWDRVRLGGAALAMAAWGGGMLLGETGGLLAADFYAHELANHPRGGIAAHLLAWLHRAPAGAAWGVLPPVGIVLYLLFQLWRGAREQAWRARLALPVLAALAVLPLACLQLRWWNLVDVLVLSGMAAWLTGVAPAGPGWGWRLLGIAWPVLPGLLVGLPPRGGAEAPPSPQEAQALIARDFAYAVVRRAGTEPVRLFSTPVFAGAAAYYGGFPVIGSADGANRAGNEAAIRVASATTEQELTVLINRLGITHLALPLWDPTLDQLVRRGQALRDDQPLPTNALVVALQAWDIPLWMRPMDHLIPKEPGFEGYELRVFATQPEQEPELALSRLADFFVERGQLTEARGVRDALQAYPRSAAAVAAQARVDVAVEDRLRLKQSLETLAPLLTRRTAASLPADRRLSLAMVYWEAGQLQQAQQQLMSCYETMDEGLLRTLTPGALVGLLLLERSLDRPMPDARLRRLAWELVPPGVRARLPP